MVRVANTALYFKALQPSDTTGQVFITLSTDFGKTWTQIAMFTTPDLKAAKRRDGWFAIDLGVFYKKNLNAETDEVQFQFHAGINQDPVEVQKVSWVSK